MTTFSEKATSTDRPASFLTSVILPRNQRYYPSPVDWREEILYFLLVDRFSDGREETRPRLDRLRLSAARPTLPDGGPWRWDLWAVSGAERWQGGTLQGTRSKLGYLKALGISALWISPVFKQRTHLDTYHGYGVQDFLEVDPHFGTRQDLADLTAAAHDLGLRVILDIIFNHSGANWIYPQDVPGGPLLPVYTTGRYPFGSWLGPADQPAADVDDKDAGVWPTELQDRDGYTRAGSGNLGAGSIDDPLAEHKRSDFFQLRDFRLENQAVLNALAGCYQYWIALTDCDGFRIDTLKHVSFEQARNFCGAIKEFAANLGKANFLMLGEIAGGDYAEDRYLDVLGRNLDAALDIGQMRLAINRVAKGLASPREYFGGFAPGHAEMGSHRNLGNRHVSIVDDHDHVMGDKIRFSSEAASEKQVAAAAALQLLTLGIPCVYYGTEQALGGPEPDERKWLPEWKSSDRYLREAMFGPQHPCCKGEAGLVGAVAQPDPELPGFGPFGSAGHHCFDQDHPAFRRIAALTALRRSQAALSYGRQYPRPVSFLGRPFDFYGPGEIIAWSRILDSTEILCVLNPHGTDARGADILVDAQLNHRTISLLTVLGNTAQAGSPNPFVGSYPRGTRIPVLRTSNGSAYIEIRDLGPSETLVLSNHPETEEGQILP